MSAAIPSSSEESLSGGFTPRSPIEKKNEYNLDCAEQQRRRAKKTPLFDEKLVEYPSLTGQTIKFDEWIVGVASSQGTSPTMEDHSVVVDNVLAVFDGYITEKAAAYAQTHLPKTLETKETETPSLWKHFAQSTVRLDKGFTDQLGGTTATANVITPEHIWTINVGNSRSLAIPLEDEDPIQLSEDQTPDNPRFAKAIKKQGGTIVDGCLQTLWGKFSVARSIGSRFIKERVRFNTESRQWELEETGLLPAKPKITFISREGIRYIITATKGLWDIASPESVTRAIRLLDAKSLPPAAIAAALVETALAVDPSDNITVIIAKLSSPK